MTKIMLDPIALAENARPISEYLKKTTGQNPAKWKNAFNRFLRGENPWEKDSLNKATEPEFLGIFSVERLGVRVAGTTTRTGMSGCGLDYADEIESGSFPTPERAVMVAKRHDGCSFGEEEALRSIAECGKSVPLGEVCELLLRTGKTFALGQAVELYKKLRAGEVGQEYDGLGYFLCHASWGSPKDSFCILRIDGDTKRHFTFLHGCKGGGTSIGSTIFFAM